MSRTPVAVVHVLGALDTGGAELRTLDVIRSFDPPQFAFEFVTLSGRRGSRAGEFEHAGATVCPMRLGIAFPVRFVRHLRATRPRVVHSHVALATGLILALARIAGVPVRIAHFHSDGDGRSDAPIRNIYRTLMRWLIHRSATHIVAVSPSALAGGYRPSAADDRRAVVLPNGVDPAMLLAPRIERKREARIVSLGRASPEKNLCRMPRVLAAYVEQYGPGRLVVIGPRNEEIDAFVRGVARDRHVVDLVELRPSSSNIAKALAEADVLLLTSTREGLPSVVLEAAAVGLPVVSSDVGGAVWISRFFPWVRCLPLDAPDDHWAEAIQHALQHRPSVEEARSQFETSPFTLQANVDQVRSLYLGDAGAR